MSHVHAHGHAGAGGRHRWRLAVALGLVAVFFVVELAAGVFSGSLALLSDAGHMAADVTTLGAALLATRLASRPDSTGRRTFGSYRAEVFASGLAVLLMIGVGVYIAIEAVARIGAPAEPVAGVMLLVGVVGLVVNAACLVLLRPGAGESLTVKGAYLEVIADSLGSIGVIAAAVLVGATGSAWWDTVIALAIALFVVVRAVLLGREVLAVLGQHAPEGMEPAALTGALLAVEGVTEVHDLHVWRLTSGMDVATAHLVTSATTAPGPVLEAASSTLRERFEIAHATLQIEAQGTPGCQGVDW
ncbi:cation diffusion facilitator family transporter [Micropruina sp.]|uniref:cation diffusion facilitator family transporter n=1 Tax=Micropruina sp. TaxID=2737536 RepID=UPI0039E2A48A